MPIPLRPNGPTRGTQEDVPQSSGYFSLIPSQLSDFMNLSPPIIKEAANDKDAGLLYSLWQKSRMTKDADRIMDRVYDVPEDFNQGELLRLKTSGFLVRKDQGVSFTEKAEQIIQTMVLGEENSFHKNSVKKPYSLILAESKAPKRSSSLTHTASSGNDKKDVMRTGGLVSLAMSENLYTIPDSAIPNSSSKWIWNQRKIALSDSGTGYKEYTVRVYENGDGTWDVWGFNGKLNGTMARQPKGRYHSRNAALSRANEVISEKHKYKWRAEEKGVAPINTSIPGKSGQSGASTSTYKQKEELPAKQSPSKPVVPPKTENPKDIADRDAEKKRKEEAERLRIQEEQAAQLADIIDKMGEHDYDPTSQ
jgi:hypothetical protein